MIPFWSDVLQKQCSYIRQVKPTFANRASNHKVAIIIEPRKYPWLEAVVRNVMYYLGEEWNLEIVTSEDHKEWVSALFPGCSYRISTIPFDNINQSIYNAFLLHSWFWMRLREEHVLVFQSDCIMFRRGVDAYLEYDYVGANYFNPLHVAPRTGGIQGGFSLRRRSTMIECLQKITWDDIHKYRKAHGMKRLCEPLHEDIFFTYACEILQKRVVPISERKAFSIEAEYYERPIAHHGTTKPYFTETQMREIISQCEDREAWSSS
jgi:hypothetical protein